MPRRHPGERKYPDPSTACRVICEKMFGKKKEIEPPIRAAVPEPTMEIPKVEEPAEPAPQKPQTVIAEDVVMVGNFDTKEPMLLLGKLKGNIHSTDSLSITRTGSLIGEAAVSALSSDGHIEGSVLCGNTAEFGSTARMKGNLSTASLKTADGSAFEGKLTMITKQAEEKIEEVTEEVIGEAAEEAIGEAAEAVSEAAETVDTISDAAEEIVEDAQDISAEILNEAGEAAGEAKDVIETATEEVKETVNQFSWN